MENLLILGTDPVCCNAAQAQRMITAIQNAEIIFARCQTCLKNMIKSICSMTCAPDQSRFMNTTIATDWQGNIIMFTLS